MRRIARHILIAALLVASMAHAQETRRGGADSSARLQMQVQQLAGERTALQAENTQLKERIARLEKEAKALAGEKTALERRAGAAESRLGRAEAGQEAGSSRLEATERRLDEVVTKYRELAEQLAAVEAERDGFARDAARDGAALKSCAHNNVELAGIANEALDRYEKKGCFGALVRAEPFTGIGRARIENLVDGYRQEIGSLQIPADEPSP